MKKYVCDKDFLKDIKNDERNVIDLDNMNPDSGPEDSDKSHADDDNNPSEKKDKASSPIKTP